MQSRYLDARKNDPGHSGFSSSKQSGFRQSHQSGYNPTAPISGPPISTTRLTSDPIPTQGWYYQSQINWIGPLSIAQLFMACVERKMNQFTTIYNDHYGVPKTLNDFPHIIRAFRVHIQKCKKYG